ncbi:MAG: nuclear transport factor 2 family protein [Alphaproteobacteria bacterium]
MAATKKSSPSAKPAKIKAPAKKPAKPPAKTAAKSSPAKSAVPKSNIAALKLARLPRPSLAVQFAGSAAKLPPRLQAILDRSEIEQLLHTHSRALDRGEENLLRSVYHADATLDLGPGVFQGAVTDYIQWVAAVMQQVKSSHHFTGSSRIDVRGDEAFGESYFIAQNRLDKPTGREDLFLAGRYLDRLERRPAGAAGVWKIAHRKQVLDWVRTVPVADIFYHLNPDALWGLRGKADMSSHMEQFPGGEGKGKMPSFAGRRYESKSIKL